MQKISDPSTSQESFTMIGRIFSGIFFGRFLIALAIVFAFYNPWGLSYFNWVTSSSFSFGMVVVGFGFVLAFAFFLYSTLRAPAKLVYFILLAFVLSIVWWLFDGDILSLTNSTTNVTVALGLIAFALALGSIWGIVWRGGTGQVSVDDPDTGE